jgi:hypothetical protein
MEVAIYHRGGYYCKYFGFKMWPEIRLTNVQVFVAIISIFIIPDLPRTTTWLTDEEKELAAWRLAEDIGEDDWVDSQHQSMFHGAKLAFKYVDVGPNSSTVLSSLF